MVLTPGHKTPDLERFSARRNRVPAAERDVAWGRCAFTGSESHSARRRRTDLPFVEEDDLPWFGSAHHRSKLRRCGRGAGFRCQSGLVSRRDARRNKMHFGNELPKQPKITLGNHPASCRQLPSLIREGTPVVMGQAPSAPSGIRVASVTVVQRPMPGKRLSAPPASSAQSGHTISPQRRIGGGGQEGRQIRQNCDVIG